MKKQKQLPTNYFPDNLDSVKISQKISKLLETAMPTGIYGMLSFAEEDESGLIFYKRWKLEPVAKHYYNIVDTFTKTIIYEHVSLFISALHIIYYLNKSVTNASPKDQLIYTLDQEYFRCLENIKFFKKKMSRADTDKSILFSARLGNSYYRLDEIKTQLSKIY